MMLKDKFIPREITSNIPIELIRWLDKDGKEIDSSQYILMKIAGDSLEPKNVYENDLIFVKETNLHEYSNLELPKICVFRRGEKYDEMINNHSKYIVCNILSRVNIFENDIDKIIDNVINSESFQKYKNDVRYVSDDFIKVKFNPIRRYSNISIYPHLNYDNNWVLEWVNSKDFLGTVEYSFTINK